MEKSQAEEELRQQVIDRFWETVPAVWNEVRNQLRSVASEKFEITVEQFHILRQIRKGSSSVSDLAAKKGISRPAMSQAVDALVDKGLISRRQDADDRRFVNLELTPDGDALLSKIFLENRAWMAGKMQALDLEDLQSVIAAFGILKRTLD